MGWIGDGWEWIKDGIAETHIKLSKGKGDVHEAINQGIGDVYNDLTGVTAANIQGDAAQDGIDETARQFDAMQALLAPYVKTGTDSMAQQRALMGLDGPEAQAAAIQAIKDGSEFNALTEQGENALLQQGAATGGLRGGNMQGALAQFRPQMLSNLINQQYGRLGGMTQLGQASAAGVGAAGMAAGAQTANLLGKQGQADATANLNAWEPVRTGISWGLDKLGVF